MDKQAWMRGAVKNKLARHNLIFGPEAQTADVAKGISTVVPFSAVPETDKWRQDLMGVLETADVKLDLRVELNDYHDVTRCGIGFHGDGERRVTVGLRLGAPIPLCFQWFRDWLPVGKRMESTLPSGTMYFMSAKAVGHDWKKPSQLTLRHAAGAAKYHPSNATLTAKALARRAKRAGKRKASGQGGQGSAKRARV